MTLQDAIELVTIGAARQGYRTYPGSGGLWAGDKELLLSSLTRLGHVTTNDGGVHLRFSALPESSKAVTPTGICRTGTLLGG